MILLGPQDDGGAAVPVIHRATGVAGVALGFFLVRLALAKRSVGQQHVLLDSITAKRNLLVTRVAPVVDAVVLIINFSHRPVLRHVVFILPLLPSAAMILLQLAHLMIGH